MTLKCGYRIQWDGSQWALCKRVKVKRGSDETRWQAFSWCGKIEHLCSGLLNMEAGAISETKPILDAFREASDNIIAALREARALDYSDVVRPEGGQ